MTTEPESARPDEGERIEDVRRPPTKRARLDWPLRCDGRRIATIDLRPPTLETLEALARAEAVSAAAVIVATSDLSPSVVQRLRWPDVVGVLDLARSLFPPEFFERFEIIDVSPASEAPPVADPSPASDPACGEAAFTDPDDEDLPVADAVDLADFVTPFRL